MTKKIIFSSRNLSVIQERLFWYRSQIISPWPYPPTCLWFKRGLFWDRSQIISPWPFPPTCLWSKRGLFCHSSQITSPWPYPPTYRWSKRGLFWHRSQLWTRWGPQGWSPRIPDSLRFKENYNLAGFKKTLVNKVLYNVHIHNRKKKILEKKQ